MPQGEGRRPRFCSGFLFWLTLKGIFQVFFLAYLQGIVFIKKGVFLAYFKGYYVEFALKGEGR